MQFMLVIYNDPAMLETLPTGEADGMMRECLTHADELRRDGRLLESRMLEDARRAKTVRIRHGRVTATDGPFAEIKEVARTGSVEVRPVQDIEAVRRRVNRPHSLAGCREPAASSDFSMKAPNGGAQLQRRTNHEIHADDARAAGDR